MMDQDGKEALLAEFRAWLDQAGGLDGPDGPGDLAAGEKADRFSLLAELAALRAEVRQEARLVKEALAEVRRGRGEEDDSGPLGGFGGSTGPAAHPGLEACVAALLELHDRLDQAARQEAGPRRQGLLARLFSRPERSASLDPQGADMLRDRLLDALAHLDIRPLPARGQGFDPALMRAEGTAADPSRPDGEVVEVIRQGFVQGQDLLRPAEVVVNRGGAPDGPRGPRGAP